MEHVKDERTTFIKMHANGSIAEFLLNLLDQKSLWRTC